MPPDEMLPALRLASVVAPLTLSVPVTLINPAVKMLPPVMLAVALTNPLVNKLPPVMLPLALTTPVTYSPVVEYTMTFDVPPMLTLTLPPELATATLDVPLLIDVLEPEAMPVSNDPLPIK
jgi:hypothetical protein